MQSVVGIVVPVFNEANRWDKNYWKEMVDTVRCRWVFVDDGSTDGTRALIEDLKKSAGESQVTVISNHKNQGKGESVREGVRALIAQGAREGGYVGFLDGDGAFSIGDVGRFVAMANLQNSQDRAIDAIWSSRVALSGRQIQRTTSRHYFGRVVHTLLALRHSPLPYDSQSGLKLFRVTPELVSSLTHPFATRWFFEIELIVRFRKLGRPLQIREEPLEYWCDVAGSVIRGREIMRIGQELRRVMVM